MKTTNRIVIIITVLLSTVNICAQNPVNQIGARAKALSGSTVTIKDLWAEYHNQAATAYLKGITVGGSYQNSFFVKELSTNAFCATLPIKAGVIGFNYYYFGYSKYHEDKLGFSFAKQLGKRISLGGQIDYFHTYIEGVYGKKGVVCGEIGILSEPLDNFYIGAHIFNISNSKLSENEHIYLPTVFKLGFSYIFKEKATIAIEVEKDLEELPIFKTGLEFEVVNNFTFQAGISNNPTSYSFGIGYKYHPLTVNISFSNHPILGYSPSASVTYSFNDRL